MKSLLLACVTVLTLFSCQKDENKIEAGLVENADWYILTAPDARAIEGVYGDIDKSIVITTGNKIYKTDDKGKTWKTANYNTPSGIFSFSLVNDTLFVLNTKSFISSPSGETSVSAKSPSFYSLDQGLTWLPYNLKGYPEDGPVVLLNKAYTITGTEYKIDEVTDGGYVETVGIITSTGQKISFPQKHQIKSVCFDTKNRLYVAASAAVCGGRNNFSFCNGKNGVLYISKATQK
jgi:hypothetical protein